MSKQTKQKIAQIFKQQVEQKGFEHVSVAQLMHQAQMRRQSFYDHFEDKYDLLTWTLKTMMQDDIENNLDYLPWQEIITLVFFDIQENANFYRSILQSQTEVDVVKELAWHFQVLLLHVLKQKGFVKEAKAYDLIETYSLGLTYTITNALFSPSAKEYDELAQKVINALEFALRT